MTGENSNLPLVFDFIDRKTEVFCELADRVWATPETCYMETQSAAAHREMLEAQGFRITDNVAGIPTALIGEAGEGGPVIAFLGEYDALAGLSQAAGVSHVEPLTAGANGHGCGHNLLGSGSLLAATALKDWLEKTGTPGRVRYYGCPAEEGGAAKAFMVREGAFKDVDIAISWHPSNSPACSARPRLPIAASISSSKVVPPMRRRYRNLAAARSMRRADECRCQLYA